MKRISARLLDVAPPGEALLGGLARNVGLLFSANAAVAICGLGSLALMAQALGPAGVGVIALIEAYGRSVDQLVRFEPSQAVIRYGAAHLEQGDELAFRRLVKFATLVDIGGALLSMSLALALLSVAAEWFDLTEEAAKLAGFYLLSLGFAVSATPIALLQLLSLFKLYSRFLVGVALLRLTLVALLWLVGADLAAFVVVLAIYSVMEHLIPLGLAWRRLLRRGGESILGVPLRGLMAENPKLLRFIFNANANVVARSATRQFDTIFLGGLVSVSDMGFYQIAKRIGIAALRLSRPVQSVLLPALARLWAQGAATRMLRLVALVNGVMALAGAAAAVAVYLLSETLVTIVFGADFAPAAPLVFLQVLAVAIFLAGAALTPALLAAGRDAALMATTMVAAGVFFAALVPVVGKFGILGAGWLHVAFNAFWVASCALILFGATLRPRAGEADIAAAAAPERTRGGGMPS